MSVKLYFQFTREFDQNLVILNPQSYQDETGALYDSYIYHEGDEEAEEEDFVADYPDYLKPACEGYYYYRGHTKDEVRADLLSHGHEEKEIYLSYEDRMDDDDFDEEDEDGWYADEDDLPDDD